ncbi:MAG: hypothetical protein WKF73_13255 [Nocardioidaceae bacterium]
MSANPTRVTPGEGIGRRQAAVSASRRPGEIAQVQTSGRCPRGRDARQPRPQPTHVAMVLDSASFSDPL